MIHLFSRQFWENHPFTLLVKLQTIFYILKFYSTVDLRVIKELDQGDKICVKSEVRVFLLHYGSVSDQPSPSANFLSHMT